jgi:hypothetical protein
VSCRLGAASKPRAKPRLPIDQRFGPSMFMKVKMQQAMRPDVVETKARAGMVFIHSPSFRVVLQPRRAFFDGSDGADPSGDPGAPDYSRICEVARNC